MLITNTAQDIAQLDCLCIKDYYSSILVTLLHDGNAWFNRRVAKQYKIEQHSSSHRGYIFSTFHVVAIDQEVATDM